MLNKFNIFFKTYQTELTWFIIGMLINNAIIHLATGQLDLVLLDLLIAGTNYYFWRTRDV